MLFLVLVPILALVPVHALAAPGWTTPEPLPLGVLYEPTVRYADGGVQFEAHLEVEGTVDDIHTQLVVTRHAVGQVEVEELRIVSTPTAVPAGMRLAVAPNGAAVLAFAERTNNDLSPLPPMRWRAAYRTADGTWETPVTLFTDLSAAQPSDLDEEVPHCAIAPDGTAVAGAVHLEANDLPSEDPPGQADGRLDLAVRPAGGAWQAAQRLSPENESVTISALRVDDDGNFLAAWNSRWDEGATDDLGDDKRTILARRLLAGSATWTGSQTVTGATGNVFLQSAAVAVGKSGRAVIAFSTFDGEAFACTRDDATTSFGSPVQIVTSGSANAQAAAVADDDAAYVLYDYQAEGPTGDHLGLVKRSPGGSWSDEYPVSALDFDRRDTRIACIGSDAIAAWTGTTADDRRVVQAVHWPASAGIPNTYEEIDERPTSLSFREVLDDRAGSVVAIWGSSADGRIRAVFDAGAPALTASTTPTGLVPGVAGTFAATFIDAWSALDGEPAWSYGDGTAGASGASVTHGFATPGDYSVTATIADTFGNARTATFAVTVSTCEALAGVDGVTCRCGGGLASGIAACDGAALPTPVGKKFDLACQAVTAAQSAGEGKKGRKAATKAAKSFKKAARLLAGKKGKAMTAPCRDALGAVLTAAKDRATELKGAL
jgi:hypothetical protein